MRAALQFLTVLPVRASSSSFGAVWFPLVGCLLGIVASAALQLPQGALLALLAVVVLTGGLHEDGVADVCDAVRAYRSREKMMEILHDSHIGAHGVLGLLFSVLLRWQALDHLTGDVWIRLPAALGISRGMIVLLAAFTPVAGSDLGVNFQASVTKMAAWAVGVQSIVLSLAVGWRATVYLLPLQVVLLFATRRWFIQRLGGLTGDCLGFYCQISETASLVLFTWV